MSSQCHPAWPTIQSCPRIGSSSDRSRVTLEWLRLDPPLHLSPLPLVVLLHRHILLHSVIAVINLLKLQSLPHPRTLPLPKSPVDQHAALSPLLFARYPSVPDRNRGTEGALGPDPSSRPSRRDPNAVARRLSAIDLGTRDGIGTGLWSRCQR